MTSRLTPRGRLSRTILATALVAVAACYTSFEESPKPLPRRAAPPVPARAPQAAPEKKPEQKTEQKTEQSYREAWRTICHAEELSGVGRQADIEQRKAAVTRWIVLRLKNTEARYWFIAMGNLKPEDRLPHFVAEARRVGFSTCPVTPILFAPRSGAQEHAPDTRTR